MPDQLTKLGALHVVRASDGLLLGPSYQDPSAHEQARAAWWDCSEKWDHLYSSAIQWKPPVVLWVSACTQERVNFWRACHWLQQQGIAPRDIFALVFDAAPRKSPEKPLPPFDCTSSVTDYPAEVLLRHLTEARPISRAHFERAVDLWNKYTDKDPRPFVRACLRGVKGFPELASVWAFVSCFLPKRTREGALRLSRFDALLLGVLSDTPQTPVAVFVHKSPAGEELLQLGLCTGDLFFPHRLDQWAQHGSVPAVERVSHPTSDNPMTAFAYRITERGQRLREAGLDDITDGPGLPLAGMEAYAATAPWVLLDDGRLARL